jgi:hypothetical protein
MCTLNLVPANLHTRSYEQRQSKPDTNSSNKREFHLGLPRLDSFDEKASFEGDPLLAGITTGQGNLPSGIFTIQVKGQECGQVQMSAAPQLLRHDIRVKPIDSDNISDNNSSP